MDSTEDHSSSLCPAQKEWWERGNFVPFYQTVKTYDPAVELDPADPLDIIQNKNGALSAIYGGFSWRDSGIKITWSQGPIAAVALEQQHIEWDHWHSSFQIAGHRFHIDFVSFLRAGPRTAYREYRIFEDNQEIARAGGYAGFLGGNFKQLRNWPLALEIDNYLVYFRRPLQAWYGARTKGQIDEGSSPIIWEKMSPATHNTGK